MTRQGIVQEALEWVGTPWQHQACLKDVATDCIGLIAGVALACGSAEAREFLDTPNCRNYGREPLPQMLRASCEKFLDRIHPVNAQPGDVLVLRFKIEPMHFAFLAPDDRMIHAFAPFGVVHHRYNDTWRARTIATYSIRGQT